MGKAKYRYIGEHAETLASGQPIEPGEFVQLSAEEAEHPHNQALIADGKIIPTGSASKKVAEDAEQEQEKLAAAEEKGGEAS